MGLLLVLFAFPGLWGFAWLFVLVVPVCGRLTAVYQVYFCIGLMPLFLCFRGGAVRFFVFLGSF